jgi:hypothetical protein
MFEAKIAVKDNWCNDKYEGSDEGHKEWQNTAPPIRCSDPVNQNVKNEIDCRKKMRFGKPEKKQKVRNTSE